jgi:ABC-2 type transport system permease protein
MNTLTAQMTSTRPAAIRSPQLQLYAREARAEILRAWRTPSFVVPTLAMPFGFYTLFGILLGHANPGMAVYTLATYGVLAALGPGLFGFGAGVAADRDAGILSLKRVSPLPAGAFLFARLAAALVFTLTVLLGLYALAVFGAGVVLPAGSWLKLLVVHLASVVPFCLLGLCVGLSVGGSAAMALTNILFFSLAVLGGLWMPLSMFPVWLQHVSVALPTYHLGALALQASGGGTAGGTLQHALVVAGFAAVCAAIAWRSWARAGQ